MIGVAGQNGHRAVELFEQHYPHHAVRPCHRPETHEKPRLLADLGRVPIRPADQESHVRRAALEVAADQAESSSTVLARVVEARDRQRRRLANTPWSTNGEVPGSYLRQQLSLPQDLGVLNTALQRGLISARGVDKVIRLAWTLTDLGGRDKVGQRELRAALHLRQGEQRKGAA